MHQDDGGFRFRNHGCHTRVRRQGADVVDYVGPLGQGFPGQGRPVGINGKDAFRELLFHSGNSRQHTGLFFFLRHRVAAGPGGFPANIQYGGAFRQHFLRLFQQGIHRCTPGTCVKRIRRHVQDAHDPDGIVGKDPPVCQQCNPGPGRKIPLHVFHNGGNAEIGHLFQFINQRVVVLPVSQQQNIHMGHGAGNRSSRGGAVAPCRQHLLLDDVGRRRPHMQQLQGNDLPLAQHDFYAGLIYAQMLHLITQGILVHFVQHHFHPFSTQANALWL